MSTSFGTSAWARGPIYSGDLGQYAWVLHRATGLGILFFLLVHIIDIMLIGLGRDVYDESVEFYGNPFLLLDGDCPRRRGDLPHPERATDHPDRLLGEACTCQKQLFWIALAGSLLLTIPSAIIIVQHEF